MNATCLAPEVLEELARSAGDSRAPEWMEAHLRSCGRCAEALAQLSRDNALLADAAQLLRQRDGGFVPPAAYSLDREIGRGGQGVVYAARHTATRRPVAIKVLSAGTLATSRERRRFEREAELVAQLRHPGIVTLHDSGVDASGRPFLVMELVEGRPLHDVVRSAGGRPTMMRLFAGICAAVAHAHARGVIHRDLKPANILVAQGEDGRPEPRILDFGLAKPARGDQGGRTQTGEFAGTLAYAAPEVLTRGADAADTRSDIYSLGVILYELLTGSRPYADGPMAEMVRRITAEPPRSPSSADPTIGPDLDTIALRALSIDPAHRYQSAESLRLDVERALAGEPIEARRDGAYRVLRRAVRRHRAWLAACLVAALALGAMSARLSVVNTVAEERRAEAEKHSARAERLLAISLSALSGGSTVEQRRTNLADVAAEAASRAGRELADDPAARARLLASLAEMLRRGGNLTDAVAYSQRALTDLELAGAAQTPAYFEALISHSYYERCAGDWSGAEATAARALSLAEQTSGPESLDTARALIRVAQCRRGTPETVSPLAERALAILQSMPAPPNAEVARAVCVRATAMLRAGDNTGAEPLLRETLSLRTVELGEHHPHLFPLREMLARCVMGQGRLVEAEEMVRELYKLRTAHRGGVQAPAVVSTRRLLAEVLTRQDRVPEALDLWDGAENRSRLEGVTVVSITLLRMPGRAAEAEALLAGSLQGDPLPVRPGTEPLISLLGLCAAERGDAPRARELAEAALASASQREGRRGPAFWREDDSKRVLARVLELTGEPALAADLSRSAGAEVDREIPESITGP